MDNAAYRFFHVVGSNAAERTWIESRLQAELPELNARLWPSETANICPLMDMGEYCLRTFHIIVHFAEKLVHGDTIKNHAIAKLRHLADRDDGSATVYLDDKQEALRLVTSLLRKTANECRDIWLRSPYPPLSNVQQIVPPNDAVPQHGGVAQNLTYSISDHGSASQFAQSAQPAWPGAGEMELPVRNPQASEDYNHHDENDEDVDDSDGVGEEDGSEEHDEDTEDDDELIRRGTGSYFCPEGLNCKKGGVGEDGLLKEFKRRCDYRAHKARHEFPWKCNLPGCKNKKGFARKDQLERHKKAVKHIPTFEIYNPIRRRRSMD